MKLGCRESREVRSLLFPALESPRNSGRRGQKEKKEGEQGATHRGRWSAAALCLQPRRRRSRPGCSSPGTGELPAAPRQSGSGSGPAPTRTAPAAAPPPAPPLPWPAGPHLLRRGRLGSGGQRARGNRTGDRPSKTQTKRQSHLSNPAPAPPAWSLVPGAAWPSRRAPALQGPGRSRSGSSLLQG